MGRPVTLLALPHFSSIAGFSGLCDSGVFGLRGPTNRGRCILIFTDGLLIISLDPVTGLSVSTLSDPQTPFRVSAFDSASSVWEFPA